MFELGSTAGLVWGLLFGAIGMGFFMYGRKQKALVPLCVGIALCGFPYFVASVYAMVLIGVGLMAIPYFVRR